MKKDMIVEAFKAFLGERDYMTFRDEYAHDSAGRIWGIDTFMMNTDPIDWLDCAFAWNGSEDGHEYWQALSERWKRLAAFMTGR